MPTAYLLIFEGKEVCALCSYLPFWKTVTAFLLSFSSTYRMPVSIVTTDLAQHVFFLLLLKKIVSIPAKKEHINLLIMLA